MNKSGQIVNRNSEDRENETTSETLWLIKDVRSINYIAYGR